MTHVTIVTKDYILIVSDEGIKDLDFVYDLDMSRIVIADHLTVSTSKAPLCWYYKKIISHLPLNGSPYLDGVDVLPPIGDVEVDDVEKLAREEILYNDSKREWWKQGYNKAREKYNDKIKEVLMHFDLEIKKHLLTYSTEHSIHGKMCDGINEIRSNIIKSLQQAKLPTGFECEMELVGSQEDGDLEVPKTFINSEGRTEWIGKWVY